MPINSGPEGSEGLPETEPKPRGRIIGWDDPAAVAWRFISKNLYEARKRFRISKREAVRRAASVQKARDDVDSETDDHRPEEERHEGVSKRDPADSSRHEVRVGNLECQSDGECDVGEVEVVRPIVGVEVDPLTVARAVVLPRVAQREDRVHAGKGERNAQHTECN